MIIFFIKQSRLKLEENTKKHLFLKIFILTNSLPPIIGLLRRNKFSLEKNLPRKRGVFLLFYDLNFVKCEVTIIKSSIVSSRDRRF